jgi:hypothetical protein
VINKKSSLIAKSIIPNAYFSQTIGGKQVDTVIRLSMEGDVHKMNIDITGDVTEQHELVYDGTVSWPTCHDAHDATLLQQLFELHAPELTLNTQYHEFLLQFYSIRLGIEDVIDLQGTRALCDLGRRKLPMTTVACIPRSLPMQALDIFIEDGMGVEHTLLMRNRKDNNEHIVKIAHYGIPSVLHKEPLLSRLLRVDSEMFDAEEFAPYAQLLNTLKAFSYLDTEEIAKMNNACAQQYLQ